MSYRDLLQQQPVLPAPMCGISDFPFRAICRRMGARLTTTQMVSSEAIFRGDKKTLTILDLRGDAAGAARGASGAETPLVMQLFGSDPQKLAVSARVLEDLGADVIDLNMGCPASKVTEGRAGSALLRDLPRVREIFTAMRAAINVPLTVKMRWDWGEGEGAALKAARMAEAEGLDGVCLHARTRKQGYSGEARWDLIGEMKATVSLPVIGNGDIREPADALAMTAESGCDAVMIGRALIGDPWLLGECLEALRTGVAPAERTAPPWPQRRELMIEHARLMIECQGERGLILFRKHAAAYLRGLPGAKRLRERLMTVSTLEELEETLGEDALAG